MSDISVKAIGAMSALLAAMESCKENPKCQKRILEMGYRAIMKRPTDPSCLQVVEMSLAMQKSLGALEGNHQNLNVSWGNATDSRGLTQRFWKMFR